MIDEPRPSTRIIVVGDVNELLYFSNLEESFPSFYFSILVSVGERAENPEPLERPVSQRYFSQLPRLPGSAATGEKCAICLEDYLQNEKLVELSCCHYFHEACVTKWVSCHPHCPTCRQHMEEQTDEEKAYLENCILQENKSQCLLISSAACCASGPGDPSAFFDTQELNHVAVLESRSMTAECGDDERLFSFIQPFIP